MINKYSLQQWSDFEGSEINEIFEEHGDDVVAFYGTEESAVAGCEHADGTFDTFGAGMDMYGITYDEMIEAIKYGM